MLELIKVDELKQYDHRPNLEINGVPKKENEYVAQIVVDLVRKLDVNIVKEDISIAHRLSPKL